MLSNISKTVQTQLQQKHICLTYLLQSNIMYKCLSDEKSRRVGKSKQDNSVTVCVVLICYLIHHHRLQCQGDQLRAMQRGGTEGRDREKQSGAAIPSCHPGNQRSFKENRPMANTGNCVFGQKVTWLTKDHSPHALKRERKRRKTFK